MFRLDQRKKIILSIGFLFLLAAVVYRAYPHIESAYPTEDKIELLETQLAGFKKQLEKRRQLRSRQQASVKLLNSFETNLFRGDTPALAAVEIQSFLDRITAEESIAISSVQVVEGKKLTEVPYEEVSVRLTFGATIAQLKQFLYSIETSPRFLKVTELNIRGASHGMVGKRFLGVTMVITGLMDRSSGLSIKE